MYAMVCNVKMLCTEQYFRENVLHVNHILLWNFCYKAALNLQYSLYLAVLFPTANFDFMLYWE